MKMLTKEQAVKLLGILATASITGVGFAIGGTIGAAVIGGIGINLSSNIIYSGCAKLKERWLSSNNGILNHDIQQALTRAFIKALTHMEREYFKLVDANTLPKNEKESIKAFFKELKEQAQEIFPVSLEKAIKEQEIREYLYGGQEAATNKLWERINGTKLLDAYNEHFRNFFHQKLLNEVQLWFTEELKTDSTECNKAWRAFQRLLLEGIQADVKAVQASQDLIHRDMQILEVLRNQLEQLKDTIDHRLPDEPFQKGLEKAISEMQVVLHDVARTTRRVEDKVDAIATDVKTLLDIEKLRGLKIPDKEDAVVEMINDFSKTLQTIGIPYSFDSKRAIDLTPFQKEVAKVVENKVDEALDKFKKPIGDPMTYILLGVFEGYLENYSKAIDYFKKVIELEFNNISAWAGMAACYEGMGEHKKALRCRDVVLMIKPPKIDKEKIDLNIMLAWAVKGYYHVEVGEYEKALEYFDKILEVRPDLLPVWDRKGIALGGLERHEEALKCFDKVLEQDPKRADMWLLKGFALRKLEKYVDAIKCFDKALEIDPKNAGAWKYKAYTFNDLKRYDEAVECLDKSLEINPKDTEVWKARSITLYILSGLKWGECKNACENIGRYGYWPSINKIFEYKELLEKTLISFKKAAELDPNDDKIREKIKEIQEELERVSRYLSAEISGERNTSWDYVISILIKHYYNEFLSREDLFDFFRRLPREVETVFYEVVAPDLERKPERFIDWLCLYVIPPLEDYLYSRKGHYLVINNASLENFIKSVVDEKYQREELLERLPYMDKDERIELFKDLTKRYLEKVKKR